jgi:hypothetical protein
VRSLLGAIFTGYSKFISQWENQSIVIFSANGLIIKASELDICKAIKCADH